ncbi:MAG: hypothetical protein MI922_14170, partial [Bacteroidales bacterium]|nr:hypothetical protein [Bacteroidales bacterium]
NLSDDYFRFIWDGQLIANNISPFSLLPPVIAENESIQFPLKDYLYLHLNSLQRSNYSCYTPLNMVFFYIPTVLFPKSALAAVIGMRVIIILAEIGTILLGKKILQKLHLPVQNIMLYAFNPLIIIELTGNLHFEAVMIFLLVVAIYLLICEKVWQSAIFMGLAISIKLVPVILLPVLFRKLKLSKWMLYSLLTGVVVITLLSPIVFSEGLYGFQKSIALYFKTFEFNASMYYIARYIGFKITGYNIIAVAGPMLTAIAAVLILVISFVRRNESITILLASFTIVYALFYILTTTVHPWYLTTLVALSVFSRYRFPIVWSMVVCLSYFTYSQPGFKEDTWILLIEYATVLGYAIYEIYQSRKLKPAI